MTELLHFDETAFHLINSGWKNAFFDWLMPVLRNKYTWLPAYLFLLTFLWLNFGKKGWLLVLALAITVSLTDSVSSHLIKKTVRRERPCRLLEPPNDLHLLVHCGGGYSFPSSHAANHFGMAVFLCLTLGRFFRWIKIPLLAWAAAVSLAQVYVGVHFPMDVLGGALLGSLIAWVVACAFIHYEGRFIALLCARQTGD